MCSPLLDPACYLQPNVHTHHTEREDMLRMPTSDVSGVLCSQMEVRNLSIHPPHLFAIWTGVFAVRDAEGTHALVL